MTIDSAKGLCGYIGTTEYRHSGDNVMPRLAAESAVHGKEILSKSLAAAIRQCAQLG